jgi:hypothetical protein
MSGQDYSIKTAHSMQEFFEGKKGKLLLKYRVFSGEWEEGMNSVSMY